jgi:hypothetical protein
MALHLMSVVPKWAGPRIPSDVPDLNSRHAKESTLLNAKRTLNFGPTVGGDLGELRSAQRFPGGLLTRKRTEVQLLPRPLHSCDQDFYDASHPRPVRFRFVEAFGGGRALN